MFREQSKLLSLCAGDDLGTVAFGLRPQKYFSYIMATNFSGGGSRSTRRETPTLGKQLVSFITCGCESSAPFFVIYKAGCEPTPYW